MIDKAFKEVYTQNKENLYVGYDNGYFYVARNFMFPYKDEKGKIS
jgi:hypothetical protein